VGPRRGGVGMRVFSGAAGCQPAAQAHACGLRGGPRPDPAPRAKPRTPACCARTLQREQDLHLPPHAPPLVAAQAGLGDALGGEVAAARALDGEACGRVGAAPDLTLQLKARADRRGAVLGAEQRRRRRAAAEAPAGARRLGVGGKRGREGGCVGRRAVAPRWRSG
jgi:hypothetical protein